MTIPNLAQHSAGSSITLGREALLQALGERLRSERRLVIGTDPILKCSSGVGQTHLVSRLVENLTGGVVTVSVAARASTTVKTKTANSERQRGSESEDGVIFIGV